MHGPAIDMRGLVISCLVSIAIAALAGAVHASSPLAAADAALREADRVGRALDEKFADLEQIDAARIAPRLTALSSLSNEDLHAAFSATDKLAFYATHAAYARLTYYVDRLQRVTDALVARNVATPEQIVTAFQAMLSARQFGKASALAARFPEALAGHAVRMPSFQRFDGTYRTALVHGWEQDGSAAVRALLPPAN